MVIKNRQPRTRARTQSTSILGLSLGIVIAAITFAPTGQAQHEHDREPQSSPESPIRIETDEYGLEWCIIGDPGNPPFPGNRFSGAFEGEGSISYEYRLARTELTVLKYHEFISAYWPYYDGDPRLFDFTGGFIRGRKVGDDWVFTIDSGMEEAATNISLRMAARYCNWLHNDKIEEEWAFATGCYDASTFTQNPDGTYNDDYTILPGARYWIPSVGEWLKGAFYDPHRYGEGQPGWWEYPNRSSVPLKWGVPESPDSIERKPADTGRPNMLHGETNATAFWTLIPQRAWAVGQYTSEYSPWGLFDTSGGMHDIGFPFAFGTSYFSFPETLYFDDMAGTAPWYVELTPTWPHGGLRIASWPEK